VGVGDSVVIVHARLAGDSAVVPLAPLGLSGARPAFVLPGADGVSYGRFVLDTASRTALLARAGAIRDPVQRAVAWQALNEEMLDEWITPGALIDALVREIPRETDDLIVSQLVGMLRGIYWRFLTPEARLRAAPAVEAMLWKALDKAPTPGRKGTFFGALVGASLTDGSVARLERIWRKQETPKGLPISETQFTGMAEALALRGLPNAEAILDEEARRITNPDRRARLAFVRPALSADPARRDSLFGTFRDVRNRRRESWVLDAMGMMNHPLRAQAALANLRPALDLVEEIQATGDIFFPLRWLNAAMDGHQSPDAARTVLDFLKERQQLPPRLKGKVLQAADDLFRAARIASRQ
jgi:aminopeptidase N